MAVKRYRHSVGGICPGKQAKNIGFDCKLFGMF